MDWRYKLPSPLRHITKRNGPYFRNEWLHIQPFGMCVVITVKEGYQWDGATCAPDFEGTIWASCLHDAIYQFCEDIAAQSEWPELRVLRFADRIFLDRMLADGTPKAIAYIYYAAVSLFGAAYHYAARVIRGPAYLLPKGADSDIADESQG